jgi:hypothetical protein
MLVIGENTAREEIHRYLIRQIYDIVLETNVTTNGTADIHILKPDVKEEEKKKKKIIIIIIIIIM